MFSIFSKTEQKTGCYVQGRVSWNRSKFCRFYGSAACNGVNQRQYDYVGGVISLL